MRFSRTVLTLLIFKGSVAYANGHEMSKNYEIYKKNLKSCTPHTFSYPHPFVKDFIGKKIIKGKVSGKCETEEIMPNNEKQVCKLSDACVGAISTEGEAVSKEALKCLSDECK